MSNDLETDQDEDEGGRHGKGGIVETLAVQLAGVLHKLVQASLFMAMTCIKTSKITECLDCLSTLVVPCDLWCQLKFTIMSSQLKANKRLFYCVFLFFNYGFKITYSRLPLLLYDLLLLNSNPLPLMLFLLFSVTNHCA
jgi:pantothenate kinase